MSMIRENVSDDRVTARVMVDQLMPVTAPEDYRRYCKAWADWYVLLNRGTFDVAGFMARCGL